MCFHFQKFDLNLKVLRILVYNIVPDSTFRGRFLFEVFEEDMF